jgi:hypothetical protein
MRSIVLALVEAVWSLKGILPGGVLPGGVLNGGWGGPGESCDGMGEWTNSAHWRSRER